MCVGGGGDDLTDSAVLTLAGSWHQQQQQSVLAAGLRADTWLLSSYWEEAAGKAVGGVCRLLGKGSVHCCCGTCAVVSWCSFLAVVHVWWTVKVRRGAVSLQG